MAPVILNDDSPFTTLTTKAQLYDSFRQRLQKNGQGKKEDSKKESNPIEDEDDHDDAPYRSIYWSPSGGTTGASQHVPVDVQENALQRSMLIPLLLAGQVYSSQTIDANLFDTGESGFLYRAREIFQDFVTQCGGTSLPLGWQCPDEMVLQRCYEFRANSMSASPSRMAHLSAYVLSRVQQLEQEQEDKQDKEKNQKELQILQTVRMRITRGVFACEPLQEARQHVIQQAFPNIRFASVIGSAEAGCWGVSLPQPFMAHRVGTGFLYDRRIVSLRVVPVDNDDDHDEEEDQYPLGQLVVTNHLRQRFPVQNYDTGDLGKVVPASYICSDPQIIEAVEHALRDHSRSLRSQALPAGGREETAFLGGVILASRAKVAEQFNIQAHTLSAVELINKSAELVWNLAQESTFVLKEDIGPFVNGQVVVWFQQEQTSDKLQQLVEKVTVRVCFAKTTLQDGDISATATRSMRQWIMTVFPGQDNIANAISVMLTSQLEASATASNRNKIPLLIDLRHSHKDPKCATAQSQKAKGRAEEQDHERKNIDKTIIMPPTAAPRTTEVSHNNLDSRSSNCAKSMSSSSADGLDPDSAWMGAYQVSPAPLWSLSSARAKAAHNGLVRGLHRVVPPRLLERIPPSSWAPYPMAMTLPLYDGIVELCANLRKAVQALLSPHGLARLRIYFQEGGLAGGLDVPPELLPLLFSSATLPATPFLLAKATPLDYSDRLASTTSEASRVSSIDLAWSKTLLMERNISSASTSHALLERDISGFSVASSSYRHADDEGEQAGLPRNNEGFAEKDAEDVDPISHLGVSSSSNNLDESCSRMEIFDAGCPALSRDLLFWRPDFLFDLDKVQRCETCSSSNGGVGNDSQEEPEEGIGGQHTKSECPCWPPSSTHKVSKLGGRLRPSSVPPVSICEINARFTMNAFSLSALGSDAAARMLQTGDRNGTKNDAASTSWSDLDVAPVHRLVVMKDEIRKRIASPGGCHTWLVKGREKGYDCHAMEELLGVSPVQEVLPADLPSLLEDWFQDLEQPAPRGGRCSNLDCPNYIVGASMDVFECATACPSHRGGTSCTLLIFLELHQDEIIKLPASALRYLTGSVPAVRNCCCRSTMRVVTCNPLPAIFLLHDKRTLALLADQKLMEGLVGHRSAEMLRKCVIPTVPLSDVVRAWACMSNPKVQAIFCEIMGNHEASAKPFQSEPPVPASQWYDIPKWMVDSVANAVHNPSDFVMKRSQSGKGAGMIYGREVSRHMWLTTLFGSESGSYILQPLVKQATFPCVLSADSVLDEIGPSEEKKEENGSADIGDGGELCRPDVCHVVGCLPFLGDASFGPGIFRASSAGPRPVSVFGGGAILLPSLAMADAPFAQKAPRWLIDSAQRFIEPSDKENERDLMVKLRRRSNCLNSCGDCAFRDASKASVEGNCRDLMEHWCALLFYSGVSVLAYRKLDIISQLDTALSNSFDENKCWILLSLPPVASRLSDAKEMLLRYGICVWNAQSNSSEGFAVDHTQATLGDSSSINESLRRVVKELGGATVSHMTSSSGDNDDSDADACAWDISPCCLSSARSHDAKAFSMHTDASFKSNPPTHFLLHVLSQDVLGGGLSSILSGGMLLRVLSPTMRTLLSRQSFLFQIPEEFRKACDEEKPTGVLQSILMTPSYRWRFRSDIVTGSAPHVIRHLDDLLRTRSLAVRMRLVPGTILLLDNGLFFHARSSVLDSSRWLKRVPFHLEE